MRLRHCVSAAVAVVLAAALVAIGVSLWPSPISREKVPPLPFPWPSKAFGDLIAPGGGYPKPLAFGTVVTPSELRLDKTRYGPFVTSFVGRNGFALGSIDQLGYPFATKDGGKTWTIAGPYFNGPWADAAAGASIIEAYSAKDVVAYGVEWLYTTNDGGRRWYVTSGLVGQVTGTQCWSSGKVGVSELVADLAQTASADGSGAVIDRAQYGSTNGGATWALVATP